MDSALKIKREGKGALQASTAQGVCAAEERRQAQPSPPPQGLLCSFSAALGLPCQQTRPTRGHSPTHAVLCLPPKHNHSSSSGSTFPGHTLHRGHIHPEKRCVHGQAREQPSWKHRSSRRHVLRWLSMAKLCLALCPTAGYGCLHMQEENKLTRRTGRRLSSWTDG